MPLTDYPKIQKIIDTDYEFKFGTYIDQGFKLFQKSLGPFIGFTLLFFLISSASGAIPVLGQIVNQFLSPLLIIGFVLYAHKLYNNQDLKFEDFFSGFKHVSQIGLRIIVVLGIILVLSLPFLYMIWDHGLLQWYWELMQNPDDAQFMMEDFPGFPWYSLLLLIPAIYLGVAYAWADMFIVFKGMNFWDALEASRQIISKKWLTFFGFTFVVALIMVSGVIGFCIGILFTFPAGMCMNYLAFADVVGLNDETTSEDDILDHLIED